MSNIKKVWDIPVFNYEGEESVESLKQIKMSNAPKAALMGDHHVGYSVPIGGVVAHENQINVSGVGYDIACGNKIVLTDMPASTLIQHRETFADLIMQSISFGVGRTNQESVESEVFEDDLWNTVLREVKVKKDGSGDLKLMAQNQLGTVGSGNHYIDVFVDQKDRVWIGCHFGSRGLGHKITTHFLKAADAPNGMFCGPCILDLDSEMGQAYFAAMNLAGRYAYAGRDWVCQKVANIMGATILEEVHNHHNFAWKETHEGKEYVVVRKGATPAFPGQKGFVGGSMGDISVILEGVDCEDSEQSLYSTIHGAGRVMSRSKAAGKTRYKRGKRVKVSEGLISRPMMEDWIRERDVVLRGAGTDESPHCYKRIEDVLKAHGGTIKIVETLYPKIVCMAPEYEFDPYKD